MIVLNGLPFLRHDLCALYPFAHQIIVVEGAAPGAAGACSCRAATQRLSQVLSSGWPTTRTKRSASAPELV